MASVRMTNELRSNILNRAMEAFAAARPQPKPNTWLTDRVRDAVLFSEPYKIMKEQFDQQQLYNFKSFGGYNKNITRDNQVSLVNLTSTTQFLGPTGHGSTQVVFEFVPQITLYRTSSWGYPEVHFEELSPQAQTDLRQPLLEVVAEAKKWHEDRRMYEHKIHGLLNQCTTVKQMLLAWPAGESFVPDENKRRMYEKITRIQRAQTIKEDVQFDDTFVNEVVLTAKLVGG